MENNLRQPLKRRSFLQRVLSARPSALRTASVTSIVALAGLGTWLVFTHEPYGGEPVVHMQIDTSDPIITSSTNDAGSTNTRQTAAKSDPKPETEADQIVTGSNTKIIDVSDLSTRDSESSSETNLSPRDNEGSGVTDLDRRKQQLAKVVTATNNDDDDTELVESPADALSIDDLARSRDEQQALVAPRISSNTSLSLVPAPVAKITGKGRHGSLPKTANDGSTAASVYARPVSREQLTSNLPKVAILIGGMGLNESLTRATINTLPPEISLAFAPYGENLQTQANYARAKGHELFIQLPMEPFGYPSIDPGPRTLLTSASKEQNIDSLHWHLSRFTGYAGVTNYLGAQFASKDAAISPVLGELGKRGLVYLDDGSKGLSRATRLAGSQGLQARSAIISLDDANGSPEAVLTALQQLEALARQNGFAIATGSGLPGTIEALNRWAQGLAGRNVILVPVSAAFSARRG